MKKTDYSIFVQALFDSLRNMDTESSLGRYGAGDASEPYETEKTWSGRLAKLMDARGFQPTHDLRYPNAKDQKCDLRLKIPRLGKLWLEVRGAWKQSWGSNDSIYRSYLFYPLIPDLSPPKTRTAAFDVLNLKSLPPHEADHVAFCLVGFDSSLNPIDPDASHFATLTGLNETAWQRHHTQWDDPRQAGSQISIYVWCRSIDDPEDG